MATAQRTRRTGGLRNLALLCLAGAAAAGAAELGMSSSTQRAGGAAIGLHISAGVLFVVVGLVLWTRRAGNRIGPLAVAIGFATFVDDLRFVPSSAAFTVSDYLGTLYYALLAHLAIAFPGGRLRSRWDRRLVAGVYAWVLVSQLFPEVLWAPADSGGVHNLLALHRDPSLHTVVVTVQQVINVLVALAVVGTVFHHWRTASRPARRVMAPVVWATGPVALAIAVANIGAVGPFAALRSGTQYLTPAALIVLPLGLLAGRLRSNLRRSTVGQLVVELREVPSSAGLRDRLAETLRDPTLQLAYWVPQMGAYVGDDGRAVDPDNLGVNVAATLIERDGEPIAALLHEPSLDEDPWLVDAVAAAAGLALENERLHADVVAQLAEVRASRTRIVEAADAERHRLERNLHDGAQQRLVTLAMAVQLARDKVDASRDPQVRALLDDAASQARQALAELRELAAGIHPSILTDAGLGPALESLAERAALPVSVDVSFAGAPPPVEAAAYYVVSEALANIGKHAGARSASVCARRENGLLVLEISDDGVGGADATRGSGLRGMADRLAALDGWMEVHSAAGEGTRIEARIPCASS